MRIARLDASLHRVPTEVPLLPGSRMTAVVVVRVEADSGEVGWGVAGPQFGQLVVECINRELTPFVVGNDVLLSEQLHAALVRRFNGRDMTGVVSSALSGIDIALWDLRGKLLGQPTWRLLGGFSPAVQAYITFGLPEYDIEQLAEAARLAVARGYSRLKMTVGHPDDLARVRAVRDAIGPAVRLMIDANESLDLLAARELARALEPLDVAWFEEPVLGNDVSLLRALREATRIPVSAGQFEGHPFRLRDLMLGGAVDVVQTNVLYVGGYTAALKVAHFAELLRLPIANGGGWPDHNAPLLAAVSNGHGVEMHAWQWTLAETLYVDPPRAANGVLTLTERAGLGLDPREDVLRETRAP